MRLSRIPAVAPVAALMVAGCIPSAEPPAPRPAPPVASVPAPPPPAPAPSSDWRDWPVTPGDWRYAKDGNGSAASFGTLFRVRCAGNTIVLAKPGTTPETVTVRTSTTARTLVMQPTGGGEVTSALSVNDRLIDAMGFSRGRFVIESAGRATLVLPAWPEVLRVAEDCRG